MKGAAKRYGIAGEGANHGKRVWWTGRGDWFPDAKQAKTWATERGARAALTKLRADGDALPFDHVAEVTP